MDDEQERVESRLSEFDLRVRIPFWQSIATGFLISLVLTVFTWRGFQYWQETLRVMAGGGVAGMILMWSFLLYHVNRKPREEPRIIIPSQRIIERPVPIFANPPVVRIEDEREQKLADLRRFLLDVEQLGSTALSVLQVRGWNKDTVAEMRTILINSNFGAWMVANCPTQGWRLLYSRKVILRRMGLNERD